MENHIVNLSFYLFVNIEDPEAFADQIREATERIGILGNFLISGEGINAMMAGEEATANEFADWLTSDPRFADLWIKRSYSNRVPFKRMTVRLKPEIVTMKVDDVHPICQQGISLAPEGLRDWIRSGEDMILIDTRNDFEFGLGSFQGSINPKTGAFNQFPDYVREHLEEWKGRKIVMFCTGGIRCEKATSWMLDLGLDEIYQLKGGVLNYFETIEDAEKDWHGELFVFDERVALDTNLNETATELDKSTGRGFLFPDNSSPSSAA